mmetsp:Transcript_49528/g.130644  ORF Transcript_49528/g.130644 Transcript_49528/m.130644 type:complete len:94 (-) Transcript_49528:324-605(-)
MHCITGPGDWPWYIEKPCTSMLLSNSWAPPPHEPARWLMSRMYDRGIVSKAPWLQEPLFVFLKVTLSAPDIMTPPQPPRQEQGLERQEGFPAL